jgi:DNA topoisomerase I
VVGPGCAQIQSPAGDHAEIGPPWDTLKQLETRGGRILQAKGVARSRRRRRSAGVGPFTEPAESAKAAALRHVSDDRPGIRRRRSGTGFSYAAPDGKTIRDREEIRRIRALAIPPAWTSVWICPHVDGHLQATGRDARGRKQYRYHPRWHEVRDETKYGRLFHFGSSLSRIRERVDADLSRPGLPREKVLATIVRLLETTLIRVGNEEYARANGSFGLTTMLEHHVKVEGAKLNFRFSGKSGKSHAIQVIDRRLARLVKRIQDLPGQDLFQYLDEAGEPQPVSSADVNEYLRLIADQDFTAKDFRTWAGTVLAACYLATSGAFDEEVASKAAVTRAVEGVAKQLGNTAAICRKCYIHPSILGAYQDRKLFDRWIKESGEAVTVEGLSPEESALLRFLDRRSVERS